MIRLQYFQIRIIKINYSVKKKSKYLTIVIRKLILKKKNHRFLEKVKRHHHFLAQKLTIKALYLVNLTKLSNKMIIKKNMIYFLILKKMKIKIYLANLIYFHSIKIKKNKITNYSN